MPLSTMNVYDTLNPDTEGIDAIGRPAHSHIGFEDADNYGAVHGIDAQSHHVETEAYSGVTRSGNRLQIHIPRQGKKGGRTHHPERRNRSLYQ